MLHIIDPELILQMASLCSTSSTTANEAFSLTDSVVAHEDWYCKEKNLINDDISRVKNNSTQLENVFQQYTNAFQQISDLVVEFILSEEQKYSEVANDIGSLFSQLSGNNNVTNYNGSNTTDTCSSLVESTNTLDSMNTISSASTPISLVKFKDIL